MVMRERASVVGSIGDVEVCRVVWMEGRDGSGWQAYEGAESLPDWPAAGMFLLAALAALGDTNEAQDVVNQLSTTKHEIERLLDEMAIKQNETSVSEEVPF